MDKMKQVAKAEVKAHEARMHKMRRGGVTSSDMKKMGRGLAKVANQKSPMSRVRKVGV